MPAHIPLYAGIYIEYVDPNRPPQWLPQVSLSSVTKLYHTASRTLLTQTFVNPSTVSPIPSAKYTFPLYESCAIVAFRCYVGKRLIEGIIKEKEDASATYQAAVERNEPASLLEQHTADVFSTTIGNIPAGATVKVEIEYIMELKHDAEVDGLRFTIPTSIAPRYGALPTGLSADDSSRAVTAKNMNISVEVSMSSSIKSVQSPSHPITLYLGGHSTDTPDDAFNPQHALATLGQTTTELGKDFILIIKCASLSSPTALLEVHPTTPNSKALMVTLVPKFNLPKSTKPEVVFIVDRSGSMSSRVAPLKSSLSVFLKSLPLDVNFNICSFGSQHSFLWDKSRPYSNQSFAEAQKYCDHIKADFGGTEILPAIKSTIQKRLKDLNLEIMVLTDGEVWNSEALFEYVKKATKKGDVRLFSLGIGRDVSHALIDGLARVGHGFSQVVSDEREGMESKVARMLRGGLSAHIVNYRLEWEGKASTEAKVKKTLSPITRAIRRFSLFDSNANSDSPISFSDSQDFTIPSVIQVPYKIQPLFPFSRSTAYAILSADARPPTNVWLRGTTPEGDELELEIAVQKAAVQGETIHQLAARKILQELKDETSYVHGAVDKEKQPGLLAEWVRKEGVRVGLKYGVASQWTSFVAVERKDEEAVEVEEEEEEKAVEEEEEEERRDQGVVDGAPPSGLDDDDDWNTLTERDSDGGGDDEVYSRSRSEVPTAHFGSQIVGGSGGGGSVPVMMMMAPPPPPITYPAVRRHATISSKHSGRGGGKLAAGSVKSGYSHPPLSMGGPTLPPDYSDLSSLNNPVGYIRPQPAFTSGFIPSPSTPSSSTANALPLIGNNPTGKAPERQSELANLGFSAPLPTLPMMKKSRFTPGAAAMPQQSSPSPSSAYSKSLSVASASYNPAPPSGPFTGASPDVMSRALGSFMSHKMSLGPAPVEERSRRAAPPPPSGMIGSFGSMAKKTVRPGAVFESQQEYAPRESSKRGSTKSFGSSLLKQKTGDIGISYSPASAPPKERLATDTASQPLSTRTKSLIDLQTFEGSFVLDLALATLLGVSLSDLEAKLMMFVVPSSSSSSDMTGRKKVWATVLAVKLFETRLAGERSVWQLVVDKARVWIAGMGVEDIAQLERMAGEALGV